MAEFQFDESKPMSVSRGAQNSLARMSDKTIVASVGEDTFSRMNKGASLSLGSDPIFGRGPQKGDTYYHAGSKQEVTFLAAGDVAGEVKVKLPSGKKARVKLSSLTKL